MANYYLKHWTEHYHLKRAQQFWDKLTKCHEQNESFQSLEKELAEWRKEYGEINSLFYFVYEHDIIWLDSILPNHAPIFNQLNSEELTFFKLKGLVIADSTLKIKEAVKVGNLSQVEYLYENYIRLSRLKIYNGFYGEDVSLAHYHEAILLAAERGLDDIVKFLVDKQQEAPVLEFAFLNTLKLVSIKNDFTEESFSKTIHTLYYLIEGYYELTGKNIVETVKDSFIEQDHTGLTSAVMTQELDYFNSHYSKVEMAYQMIRQLIDNGTIKMPV